MHLAADSGGVDEPPRATVKLDELVDGVAGGARQLVDDDALAAGQGVEQGGLSDVRAAYQGDAARAADWQGRGDG